MKTDNICDRCKKPMDTTKAEMNAIHYRHFIYRLLGYARGNGTRVCDIFTTS